MPKYNAATVQQNTIYFTYADADVVIKKAPALQTVYSNRISEKGGVIRLVMQSRPWMGTKIWQGKLVKL